VLALVVTLVRFTPKSDLAFIIIATAMVDVVIVGAMLAARLLGWL
jgi:hypothetical protein